MFAYKTLRNHGVKDPPNRYTPNQPPDLRVSASYKRFSTPATDEELEQALSPFQDALENIGMELFKRGDIRGAALSVLLHRHVFPGNLFPFMNEIDDQVAVTPDQYRHVGIEHLEAIIDNAISAAQQAKM